MNRDINKDDGICGGALLSICIIRLIHELYNPASSAHRNVLLREDLFVVSVSQRHSQHSKASPEYNNASSVQ